MDKPRMLIQVRRKKAASQTKLPTPNAMLSRQWGLTRVELL